MNCKSCSKTLPTKRVELGFNHCVDCSETEAYGTIDIVYHKTGNTVEHVDKETASHVNKISRRSGFGSSLGKIKSGGIKEFSKKIEKGCSLSTIGSPQMFEKVGNDMITYYEIGGLEKAYEYLDKSYKNVRISGSQYATLKRLIENYSKVVN